MKTFADLTYEERVEALRRAVTPRVPVRREPELQRKLIPPEPSGSKYKPGERAEGKVAARLLGVDLAARVEPHRHQCWFTETFGQLEGIGCGHVWEHARNPALPISRDHMCPKCGSGPWYAEAP